MMDFFTLKWGDKYGPEYVNRLYGSLAAHYKQPFTLTCYTDDYHGIREEVQIKDIQKLRPYNTDRIFTYEKLILMEKHEAGTWLDLDVLIHQELADSLGNNVVKSPHDFTMIWNHWNNYEQRSLMWYGKGSSCHVNSSFVNWNNCEWLPKYTHDNWNKLAFTYKSLDKYLFYQHHRNGRLNYWPDDLVSNYNVQGFVLKNKITIFNTSHIKANNLSDIGFELHEAKKEIVEMWESYGS